MNNQPKTTADQYRQVQLETSTTLDLLQLAYTGIVESLTQALSAIEDTPKSYDAFNDNLSKAQQIVSALDDGLDENEGELAETLADFYQFLRSKLIESNMEKSPDLIRQLITVVEQVQSYWQASTLSQIEVPEKLPDDDSAVGVDVTG